MNQKLAIARTLLIDQIAAASLHEDIVNLAAQDEVTIFLTTHNMAEDEKLCHQLGIIREGVLPVIGNLDQLRTQASKPKRDIIAGGFTPQLLERLQSYPGIASLERHNRHLIIHHDKNMERAPLVNLLVSWGSKIEEVRKSKARLEETYLELVEDKDQ